ncbi:adenosylhomocysteinase [Plantibacter flavus]|uniref:adenosylhomocysteinase n=1 Tax=Plantibacter flavus TaxID=150123 RepID=UPI003F17E9E7
MTITTPQQTALPRSGDPDTDWAARSMPLLARTMNEFGPAFAGLHLGICLHLEPKTAVLCQWLLAYGATVTITGNLGTTDPRTAELLAAQGAHVIGGRDDDEQAHARNLDAVVERRPDLILDNGGELIERLTEGAVRSFGFLGATEETTTGGTRVRGLRNQPDFPVIVINDSPLKLLVENEYGVGQSIVQGFMNATNRMLPALRAVVIGFGPCGKGVADTLRALGARVTVIERDPFRALEAIMSGHRVESIIEALPQAEAVFLSTGRPGVLSLEDLRLLPDGAIIAGVGHQPDEADIAGLAANATETVNLASSTDADARIAYRLDSGKEIIVLHGTKMVNLTAAKGNPIEAMDLGLSLQAASLGAIALGRAAFVGVESVPEEINQMLATGLVEILR